MARVAVPSVNVGIGYMLRFTPLVEKSCKFKDAGRKERQRVGLVKAAKDHFPERLPRVYWWAYDRQSSIRQCVFVQQHQYRPAVSSHHQTTTSIYPRIPIIGNNGLPYENNP